MDDSRKLQAIKRLRLSDGINWTDAHDIAQWSVIAGAKHEMAQFSEKTLERIRAIYEQYYEG